MGALRRCEAEPAASAGAGGGGKSLRYGGGTPRACARERGTNAENGLGNGIRDDGPVGALRGALPGESETAGGAVD